MKLIEKKIIDYLGEKYIILSVMKEQNEEFAFGNQLDNYNEPTDEYYIFKKKNDDIEIIVNQEIIYKLLPKFQRKLKNNLDEILNMGE